MVGSPGVLAEGVTCRAYGAKTERTHCATWHAKGKGWVVCNSLSEMVCAWSCQYECIWVDFEAKWKFKTLESFHGNINQ